MSQHADIFDRLRADHDRQRDLLERLEALDGDSPQRRSLFEEFTKEAKGHAAAEEQALYSTMMRKPEMTSDARHSVAEHHEIEELLNDLAATDPTTDEWNESFDELRHQYLHHIDEEEEEMFPHFASGVSEEDAMWMRQVFERRKVAEKASAEVTPEKMEDAKQ